MQCFEFEEVNMTSVSIVGVMGGGKTTALGLLHEGLTAYAAASKNFQFEAGLASAGYLYDVVRRLRSGEFPEKTPPGSREEVKLKMRFKRTLGWNEIELDSYDISGEDIMETLEAMRSARSVQQIISDLRERKTLAAILNSDVFIFVVDSLVCDPTHSKESEAKKAEHDLFLGHLCLALQEYKKGTRGNIKALALIFAKYDLAELFLPLGRVDYYSMDNRETPMETEKETQSKSFEEVVKTYLVTTYNNLRYALKTVKPSNLKYFRSGVMTKKDEQTGLSSNIALPLQFTANEYVRIARWLSEV